ncbi:MAG: helix-turn-helix transcriptional regulator [Clostridia bacterium]|nr:helix-turn-helix transcriptional regulator [Clostridia bacterium]
MGANMGALTEAVYYILLSLLQPLHGYGIMQNVEKLSGGRLKLAAGTLYGAISSMLEKGWIVAHGAAEDSRKKEYVITDAGEAVLCGEYRRLRELVDNGSTLLDGHKEDAE